MILDTCAVSRDSGPAPKMLAGNVSNSGPQHTIWTAEQLLTSDVFGGIYKLCWCSAVGSCISASDFHIDIGNFLMLGPVPFTQDRTCVAGLSCVMDGIVMHGSIEEGSVSIMDTCGRRNHMNFAVTSSESWQSGQSGQSVWSLQLALSFSSFSSGSYRLCWCGVGVCRVEDFTVDFGRFDLLGPVVQDRTCFSGMSCSLTDQSHSAHLEDPEDLVFVLDTCADAAPLFRSLNKLSTSSASGAFVWTHAASAPGGQYRLCWCSKWQCNVQSMQSTQNLQNAFVDFGKLTLIGPAPLYQHHTCVSGLSCLLDEITGTFSSFTHRVWALDTCGTLTETVIVPIVPHSIFEPGLNRLTLKGGQYRLCWCFSDLSSNESNSINSINSQRHCQNASDFVTDFGSLLVVGVSPLSHEHTCISGQHCSVDGIGGYFLSPLDQVLLQETCGVSAVSAFVSAFVSVGATEATSISWSEITLPGGEYRLCWCHGNVVLEDRVTNSSLHLTNSFQLSCGFGSESDGSVDIGSLTLLGPSPFQDRTCRAGQCQVDMIGIGLETGDVLLVLDTCGDLSATPYGFSGDGAHLTSSSGHLRGFQRFFFEVSSLGGEYRLCWCSNSTNCEGFQAFRLDIGQMTVLGASSIDRDFTCTSGRSCLVSPPHPFDAGAFAILATCGVKGLQMENQISDCTSGRSCLVSPPHPFDAGAFAILATCGVKGLQMENQISESLNSSWNFGRLTSSGGRYQLCWCSFSASSNNSMNVSEQVDTTYTTSASSCQDSSAYFVDAGTLHLLGPFHHQDRTCVGGQSCHIESLVGYGLSADKLLVMDTCSVKFPHGFPDACV